MLHRKSLSGILIIALLTPLSVEAAEWFAEPKISLKTGYNDNIRLTSRKHDSVWETALKPSVKFGAAKENQGLSGDAGFAIRRFSGGSGLESSSALDREDYHLNTDAYHQTERDTFRGNIKYTRDSTLNSGLDETGNVVPNNATRNRFTLVPSWERMLSENMSLNLGYQFTTVSYSDEPVLSRLVEYDYHVFSSSLVRQLTPRIQGTLSASYNNYKPKTGFDSSTITLQAGISRNFSETLVASFLAGWRETTSDRLIGGELETTGSVFSASITKILETGSLGATLSRSTNPGSNGELLDTTRLILSGEHRFTETLRSSLTVEYNERETIVNRVGGALSLNDRTLWRIRPKISWRWSREWELAGQYEYADEDDQLSRKARRNAAYLTVSYRPTKIYVSR